MSLPPDTGSRQDSLYAEAAAMFGPALQRLARAYGAQPHGRNGESIG
jgi:hypothetical protein